MSEWIDWWVRTSDITILSPDSQREWAAETHRPASIPLRILVAHTFLWFRAVDPISLGQKIKLPFHVNQGSWSLSNKAFIATGTCLNFWWPWKVIPPQGKMLQCWMPDRYSSWEKKRWRMSRSLRFQRQHKAVGSFWAFRMSPGMKHWEHFLPSQGYSTLVHSMELHLRRSGGKAEGRHGGHQERERYLLHQKNKVFAQWILLIASPSWLLCASVIINFHIFYWD